MRFRHTTTLEFDAPLERVRALLADEGCWPLLLSGLERLGTYWRYGGELYELRQKTAGDWLVLHADSLAQPEQWLIVAAHPEDTGITTRLALEITADLPLRMWWWARKQLIAQVQSAGQALAARVGEQPQTATPEMPSVDGVDPLLAARYPRTVAAFSEMHALDHLERVTRLDGVWQRIREQGTGNREQGTEESEVYELASHPWPPVPDIYDLIYAGGGLGLLHAAVMAQRYGRRVLLFDRGEVGCAHREWNISRVELQALVDIGLFTWDELRDVVMNQYERGIVRFHKRDDEATDLWLPTVLNVALDAGRLLQLTRAKLERAGGVVLDQRVFRTVCVNEHGPLEVCVEVEAPGGGLERYQARLLLDGMGSVSPLALKRFAGQPFAGVCPTVGTVVSGLVEGNAPHEHNRRIGDILLSIDDAQRGQQYMWEGFPGRGDELTVYLFYYDTLREQGTGDRGQQRAFSSPTLMQLFEDYFALLPSYKRPGPEFRHHKPVYGYIPARHSVRRQEAPLLRGVLPVGDSAAQQSPLTFCGFGSHVRNLDRTTGLLHVALERNVLEPEHLHNISAYQVNVSLNWVFSRFMQPWDSTDDVNALQNIFLQVLNSLGVELAERFFQDRMRWSDYHKMVLGMFVRYPQIVRTAWRVLGPEGCRQWISDYVVYSRAALLAGGARLLGARARKLLLGLLGRCRPADELRAQAAFAEWHASGWL